MDSRRVQVAPSLLKNGILLKTCNKGRGIDWLSLCKDNDKTAERQHNNTESFLALTVSSNARPVAL